MIDLKFKDKIYTIKTSNKEFTVDEFEDIYYYYNSECSKYEKCVNIFLRLGLQLNLIANLDAKDIFKIMKEFDFDYRKSKISKTIILNNIKYTCYDKSFKLTVKKILLIESYININPKKYFAELLAILYTNDECKLTINEKAKLIRETITADIAIPLINEITTSIIDLSKMNTND